MGQSIIVVEICIALPFFPILFESGLMPRGIPTGGADPHLAVLTIGVRSVDHVRYITVHELERKFLFAVPAFRQPFLSIEQELLVALFAEVVTFFTKAVSFTCVAVGLLIINKVITTTPFRRIFTNNVLGTARY